MQQNAQLEHFLQDKTDRIIPLPNEVELERSYPEHRFWCKDCAFILCPLHLKQGIWHLLPENLHDFDVEAIALTYDAIVQVFGLVRVSHDGDTTVMDPMAAARRVGGMNLDGRQYACLKMGDRVSYEVFAA